MRTPSAISVLMAGRFSALHMQGPSGDAREDKRTCECMGWPDLVKAFGRGKE
nr:MAG TPA: hypothetical protein [Caudoviricetes sp.]